MSRRKFVIRSISVAAAGLLASVDVFATTGAAQAAEEWNPDRRTRRPTPATAPTRFPAQRPTCRTSASSASRVAERRGPRHLLHDQHDDAPQPGRADHEVVRPRQLGDRQLRVRPREHRRRRSRCATAQNSYGQGQWASSLRYHDGTFYVALQHAKPRRRLPLPHRRHRERSVERRRRSAEACTTRRSSSTTNGERRTSSTAPAAPARCA